jgi:hypothetical protein
MIDGPKTTWEISEQIHREANQQVTDQALTKFCNKIRYRLGNMETEGYIVHDKKTKRYALENTIIGNGILTLKTENGEEILELGLTIVTEINGMFGTIFMESIS